MSMTFRRLVALLAVVLLPLAAQAEETTTYYVNDLLGSPVAAMDEQGNVLWTETYAPYGARLDAAPAKPGNPSYTGKPEDPVTGLVYMGARWYDPETARFTSVDPVWFVDSNVHSFNRYAYANNSPYVFVDPDGRSAAAITYSGLQADLSLPDPSDAAWIKWVGWGFAVAGAIGLDYVLLNGSDNSEDPSGSGNTNPYDGPVDEPVIVVDGDGNAIPVGEGESISSSPDGQYQQVRDTDGRQTGVRIDKGGHRGHSDPKARAPHAHRPGVTDETGNPHLPINGPKATP